MIGRLRGKLLEKKPPIILVDCNGIGYEIESPMSSIYELPDVNEEVTLHIQLVIKEDAHLMFGFVTELERSLFRLLIKVSGIGSKIALVILSGMTVSEFVACVKDENWNRLVSIPGIGRKTAERLVLDIRDKVELLCVDDSGVKIHSDDVKEDAISALVSLGYKNNDAINYVDSLEGQYKTSEEIIRQVLKNVLLK